MCAMLDPRDQVPEPSKIVSCSFGNILNEPSDRRKATCERTIHSIIGELSTRNSISGTHRE